MRLTVGKRCSPGLDISAEILRAEDTDIVNFAGSNPPSEVGDSYTILNLRATFSPDTGLLEGTTIRVGLENATDEAYVPNLSTRFQPGANAKLTVTKAF